MPGWIYTVNERLIALVSLSVASILARKKVRASFEIHSGNHYTLHATKCDFVFSCCTPYKMRSIAAYTYFTDGTPLNVKMD